ncbi:hypothetical protein IQ266_14715 [filamentous cyanobacterium LEGE 11480]|uniref:Uncharacterized protein n=1 Tax=Romeriopsis navalis LEGE 11480 TaxID=2777977 RepID=A0A928VRW8_9CYAN|nr:hypothetical protein [Romeriopsis navalis]MBE9030984.1 hypothetical protein [Romeriopsis navalis LEGE 11480]
MMWFLSPPSLMAPAIVVAASSPSPVMIARRTCPTDITQLTPQLLRDLPSYANRVIVRSRSVEQLNSMPIVVLAGQAEYAPLPVVAEKSASDPNLRQIFFTTLERQRVGKQLRALQQYHWLLITPTSTGWQIVLSYTRTGAYPQASWPVTPPRESSQGPIAQAAKLWFRDCHAGAVRS